MGHQQNGVSGTVERKQKLQDLPGGGFVQIAGGFIGQQNVRMVDEGTGNGDPLALPAGELGGKVVQPLSNAEAVCQLPDLGIGNLFAVQRGRKKDVLLCGEDGQKPEILIDVSNLPAAEPGGSLLGEGVDVLTIQKT